MSDRVSSPPVKKRSLLRMSTGRRAPRPQQVIDDEASEAAEEDEEEDENGEDEMKGFIVDDDVEIEWSDSPVPEHTSPQHATFVNQVEDEGYFLQDGIGRYLVITYLQAFSLPLTFSAASSLLPNLSTRKVTKIRLLPGIATAYTPKYDVSDDALKNLGKHRWHSWRAYYGDEDAERQTVEVAGHERAHSLRAPLRPSQRPSTFALRGSDGRGTTSMRTSTVPAGNAPSHSARHEAGEWRNTGAPHPASPRTRTPEHAQLAPKDQHAGRGREERRKARGEEVEEASREERGRARVQRRQRPFPRPRPLTRPGRARAATASASAGGNPRPAHRPPETVLRRTPPVRAPSCRTPSGAGPCRRRAPGVADRAVRDVAEPAPDVQEDELLVVGTAERNLKRASMVW
ncbi:hypothetical protein FB451DRAFT_1164789 [Mycena latifolia]|nr:hypothetical protein FB451DRAFT_1164789 [Mycena latifolia]